MCVYVHLCIMTKMFEVLEIQFVYSSLFSSYTLPFFPALSNDTDTTQCMSKYSARYLFIASGLKTKLKYTCLKKIRKEIVSTEVMS